MWGKPRAVTAAGGGGLDTEREEVEYLVRGHVTEDSVGHVLTCRSEVFKPQDIFF